MKINIDVKTYFRNFGILLLIIVIVVVGSIYLTLASENSYKSGMKRSIETVLSENDSESWSVGNNIKINNSESLNAFAFECKNNETEEECKAVIVRVSTFYGPMAVVYICDSNNEVYMKGVSSVHGRIGEEMKMNKSDKRIEYWQKKIPDFFK